MVWTTSGATADATDPVTVWVATSAAGSKELVKSCEGTGSPASVDVMALEDGSGSAASAELVTLWTTSGATADSTEPVTVCVVAGIASGSMLVVKSWLGKGSPASVDETVVDVGRASVDSAELVRV